MYSTADSKSVNCIYDDIIILAVKVIYQFINCFRILTKAVNYVRMYYIYKLQLSKNMLQNKPQSDRTL